ncbi:MAG: DUF4293 domain-containing protein [Saprospiraceae bacterium]|jgi:Na+-translocating ferredoxin:NAD+ oxidoreductase RnfA subunit|nr:DUF4293 domain-containing protein [Saprospiraceae bacterium]MBL0027095.1 DUF4293 domain-containing protein [Saprospiraceae bacterium]
MIQRIQSIFLLICSTTFFGLFGVPFATSRVPIPYLFGDLTYNIQDSPVLLAMAVFGGLVSLIAIFLYNKRPVQLKLAYLSTVLSILLPLVVVLLVYNEGTATTQADKIDDGVGVYLPVIGIICSILAARYIAKDENTVKSMDRLR